MPVTVTGTKTEASTTVGDIVCHYGEKTGYSCGSVYQTNYAPQGNICAGGPCAATYVAVAPPPAANTIQLACAGGDSGGPWFNVNQAAGVHFAGSSGGTAQGQCLITEYTSVDLVSTLGLSILTAPSP